MGARETPLIPSAGNFDLEVENEKRDSPRGYEPFGFKPAAAGARRHPDTCWDCTLHGMGPKIFAVVQRCYVRVRVREIVVAVIKGSQETLG